jgi:hypothetical protein
LKQVTADDCARFLRQHADPAAQAFRGDARYVDAEGYPTSRMARAIERAGHKTISEAAKELYEERGVTCFSESPSNTLLWSHYGGAHKGICLEFDTSSPLLQRLHAVRYSDDIPEFDIVETLVGNESRILDVMLTKAGCWSYEQEWRAIHREADKEYCYGVEALTGVYLGAALTESERDLICHILHGTPTRLFEIKRSATSFGLEIHSLQYTPYRHDAPDAV